MSEAHDCHAIRRRSDDELLDQSAQRENVHMIKHTAVASS